MSAMMRTLKYGIIRAGLEVTALPSMRRMFRSAAGRGVIFTLHHVRPEIGEPFAPNALLSVTPEFLEQAIIAAKEEGLAPVHLHDLPALLADGAERRNFVAFTLDDGYRNNAAFAAPVFCKFSVPYTIFITRGFVQRERTIWWETAEALTRAASSFSFDFGNGSETVQCVTLGEKSSAFHRLAAFVQTIDEDEAVRRINEVALSQGVSPEKLVDELIMDEMELRDLARDPLVHFGAHTVDHVNLRRASAERLMREIKESALAVEQYAGEAPRSFSYPYGWSSAVGPREMAAAAEAGFAIAVTTRPGVLTTDLIANPTGFPRVSLNGYYQKKRYVKALISGIPFRLTRGGVA